MFDLEGLVNEDDQYGDDSDDEEDSEEYDSTDDEDESEFEDEYRKRRWFVAIN